MSSFNTASALIGDVEMALLVWTDFGKGLIKKLQVSPDGFLQLVLQLAFYRVSSVSAFEKFSLQVRKRCWFEVFE